MRMVEAGMELRMKLGSNEPWMITQLDNLHKLIVGGRSTDHQSLRGQRFSIRIIEFITMTVSFVDIDLTINVVNKGIFL